jgi:glutaredoxin 3
LLTQLNIRFDDIDVEREPARRVEMIERSGRRTVPQIWIDDQHIGGCDELYALYRAGRLAELLASSE